MANNTLNIPQLGNRFVDYRDPVRGDSYNWAFNRKHGLSDVKQLVIHHSVTTSTVLDSDGHFNRLKTWEEQVNEIADIHILGENKWAGVGYHFIITTDGVVAYVGDIGTGRANVLNHNDSVIGICMVGDFTKHLPTDIQINSAHDLLDYFLFHEPRLPNTKDWDDVIGHKDAIRIWTNTTATVCPGTSWPIDMKSRIKDSVCVSLSVDVSLSQCV